MSIESNMSPSSCITSPMDLVFANIGDEHSLDNIDLNNITPSIKLASSLDLVGPNTYPPDCGGCLDKSLSKNDVSSSSSRGRVAFSTTQMPSTSCPTQTSDGAYARHSGPFNSPATGLNIPHPGGNASGESGCSSLTTGNWGGSGVTAPCALSSGAAGADNQHVALIKARTKKDSHNRIERKRRDYINCQITELVALLPEDMFRENECKKNKGSILKNSVEYICALQKESQCHVDVFNEASLASTVINRLVKRIQDLESLIPADYLNKLNPTAVADYRSPLHEWSKIHDLNQQKYSSSNAGGAACTNFGTSHLSLDTSGSSPGVSSIGNNDDIGVYSEIRGDSPVSQRTRCTSVSSSSGRPLSGLGGGGGGGGGKVDKADGGYLLAPPFVGSLPTHSSRILPSTPVVSPLGGGYLYPQRRSLASQTTTSVKNASQPTVKIVSKRTANGQPATAKIEESGSQVVTKKGLVYSNGCGNDPSDGFGILSTSLPVRIASDDFPTISEMESDESYLQAAPDGRALDFNSEPMAEVPVSASSEFHSHSPYQSCLSGGGGGGGGTPSLWSPSRFKHLSGRTVVGQPNESSPAPQGSAMSDELQFDPVI